MRTLLFLCHRFPYPPNKGEKIRSYNLLRHLASRWRVFLGCLADDPADLQHLPHLREMCAEIGCFTIDRRRQKALALLRARPGRPLMPDFYRDAGLHAWVDGVMARERIDKVLVCTAAMAPYVMREQRPGRVLDMQDIDSEKWASYATTTRLPMSLVWAREGRTLLAFERRAALAFDRTTFVSEQECRRFAELAPESRGRVSWVENGVDLDAFSPAHEFPTPYADAGPHFVFTGHMDYWPNADAAIWFAREAMPLLRRRAPEARFHVVGANPGPEVAALAALSGVHVTGRVPDVRPYVAHAAAAVAPLRIARGIQNKVLEAMAMGRPVIASPEAFEGVRAEKGRDVLVGDGAEALALLAAEVAQGAHPGLGARARRAVEGSYAWPRTLARMDAILDA